MQTYEQFAAKHDLMLNVIAAGKGLMDDADKGSPEMDKWACRLYFVNGKEYLFPYYMGTGHNGKAPEIGDVLNSLASDAAGTIGVSFEDWCTEYGYDDDSRRAERTYNACQRIARELRMLLGSEELDELLYETNEEGE